MYGLHGLPALLRVALRCCLPSLRTVARAAASKRHTSMRDRYVGLTASGSTILFLRVLDRKENSTLLETELRCMKKGIVGARIRCPHKQSDAVWEEC